MVGVSGMDGFEQWGSRPKPLIEGLRPLKLPIAAAPRCGLRKL